MSEAPYARIVAHIRSRIDSGELRPGDRVPSARQITREHGVAIATATKVLAALTRAGLVTPVPGVGTVVRTPAATPHRDRRRAATRPADGELTAERIVRAAIQIADTEGMAALSMRRVATYVDTATMSLYHYVPSKDELVLAMMDRVLADNPLPDLRPAGWRAQLELSARTMWAGCRRHPWLAPLISMTRPQPLPHGIAYTEWALRAVDGLGLDPNTMLHVAVGLYNFVRGIAVNLEPEAEAEQQTGITDEEWMEQQGADLDRIVGDAFPTFARLLANPELTLDLESLFEFGLRQWLDGLTVLIGQSAGATAEGAPAG
jgi:AcrR family transcriptional regulator